MCGIALRLIGKVVATSAGKISASEILRFYSAILDAVFDAMPTQRRPDVLFTHCNGKYKMPVVVEALRALDVPLRVVADFDVLREERPLRSIFEGLGGTWATIASDWGIVTNAISQLRPQLGTEDVKKQVDNVLAAVASPVLPDAAINQLREITKKSSAWSQIKTAGLAMLPAGAVRVAADRVCSQAAAIGFHIVPVGELESFDRTIGDHGPEWVNTALQQDLLRSEKLTEARKFVRNLVA